MRGAFLTGHCLRSALLVESVERGMNECVNVLLYRMHVIRINVNNDVLGNNYRWRRKQNVTIKFKLSSHLSLIVLHGPLDLCDILWILGATKHNGTFVHSKLDLGCLEMLALSTVSK